VKERPHIPLKTPKARNASFWCSAAADPIAAPQSTQIGSYQVCISREIEA
jgi:hypothetical protein